MDWKGEFYIGETWLVYRGRAADNRPHAHATLQLTVSLGPDISISDQSEQVISGAALCVKAGKRHTLHPSDRALLVLIEPQSQLAHYVQSFAGDDDVSSVDPNLIAQVNWEGELDMDLSRFRSDLEFQLSCLSFEYQGAFPSKC